METRELKPIKAASQQDRAELVSRAMRCTGEVFISYGTARVNVKSLMGVLSLPLREGAALTLTVKGDGEAETADEIARFINSGFIG